MSKKLLGLGGIIAACLFAFILIIFLMPTRQEADLEPKTTVVFHEKSSLKSPEILIDETREPPIEKEKVEAKLETEKARVFGTVSLASNGETVAGAEVVLLLGNYWGGYAPVKTTSDASGNFEMAYRVQRAPLIYARKGDQISFQSRNDLKQLDIGRNDTSIGPVHLELQDASILKIKVVSEITGKPLQGAQGRTLNDPKILFKDRDNGLLEMTLSGEFWSIQIMAPGHEMTQVNMDLTMFGEDVLVVPLKPAVAIQGEVLDLEGKAVEDAWVFFSYKKLRSATKTDAGGRFQLEYLPLNQTVYVHASKHGIGRSTEAVETQKKMPKSVVLVLEPPKQQNVPQYGTIEGFIVNDEDQPLPDANIIFQSSASGRQTVEVTSNIDGFFSIQAPVGRTQFSSLFVKKEGFAFQYVPLVLDAEKSAQVKVVLERGHYLRGFVRNKSGDPIEKAYLRVFMPRLNIFQQEIYAKTDIDGYFALEDLPDKFNMTIRAESYTPFEVENPALDEDQAEFILEGLGKILGRVVYKESGEPVSKYALHFQQTRPGRGNHFSSGDDLYPGGLFVNKADGSFLVEDLEVGLYFTVSVNAETHGMTTAEPVHILPPGEESPLLLEVEPFEDQYAGVVLQSNGQPLEGVMITLRCSSNDLYARDWRGEIGGFQSFGITYETSQISDSAGRFSFEDVPSSKFVFLVGQKDEFSPKLMSDLGSRGVEMKTQLRMTLLRSATLVVTIEMDPFPKGGVLNLWGEAYRGKDLGIQAGKKKYEYRDLNPGKFELMVLQKPASGRSLVPSLKRSITLEEGETRHIVLEDGTKKQISGIALVGGMPASRRKVSLKAQDGDYGHVNYSYGNPEAVTDDQGAFSFKNIKSGDYKLMLFSRQPTWDKERYPVGIEDSPNAIRLTVGEKDIEDIFEFRRWPNVKGSLVKGSGVSGVILSKHGYLLTKGFQAVLNEENRFEFLDIEPGMYSLHILTGSTKETRVVRTNILVSAGGSDVDLGEIDAEPSGQLRVSLSSSEIPVGLPKLDFALVNPEEAITDSRQLMAVQYDWRVLQTPFVINGLAVGTYGLVRLNVVSGFVWEPTNPVFEIKPEETTDVVLTLRPVTSCQGSLPFGFDLEAVSMEHGESGSKLNLEFLTMQEALPALLYRETFAIYTENAVAASGVLPGVWRFRLLLKNGKTIEKKVVLKLGESVFFTFPTAD